jgi:hypothetical protein
MGGDGVKASRARIPRANPCNMFRRYRNLDAREKMTWNIVECRIEFEISKREVYI